jgi:hypothetical protein
MNHHPNLNLEAAAEREPVEQEEVCVAIEGDPLFDAVQIPVLGSSPMQDVKSDCYARVSRQSERLRRDTTKLNGAKTYMFASQELFF